MVQNLWLKASVVCIFGVGTGDMYGSEGCVGGVWSTSVYCAHLHTAGPVCSLHPDPSFSLQLQLPITYRYSCRDEKHLQSHNFL